MVRQGEEERIGEGEEGKEGEKGGRKGKGKKVPPIFQTKFTPMSIALIAFYHPILAVSSLRIQ